MWELPFCGNRQTCEGSVARLAQTDLLKRCPRGVTQNKNECLHSKSWAECPKTGFVGFQRVVSATSIAVAKFNSVVEVTMRHLCGVMGIASRVQLLESAVKADCSCGGARSFD